MPAKWDLQGGKENDETIAVQNLIQSK